MFRPGQPQALLRHAQLAPAPPSVRGEDFQPQEGLAPNRRSQVPAVRTTPYPQVVGSKQAAKEKKLRQRERKKAAAAEAADSVRAGPIRNLWQDVRGPPPGAPTGPSAMRRLLPAPQRPIPVSQRRITEDEEEYLNSLPSSSVLLLARPPPEAPIPAPLAPKQAESLKIDAVIERSPIGPSSHPPSPSASLPLAPTVSLPPAVEPPVPRIKREPGCADLPIPPSASVNDDIARDYQPAPGPAPVEQPDIKPNVRRMSSPPAPLPLKLPKKGVASWTAAEVPADCNLKGLQQRRERDRARQRFRLRAVANLQNERKIVEQYRWVSGGLVLDWRFDNTQGTWTVLYPPDVVRSAKAKARFLADQVALVEAKGWSVTCAGDKTTNDGAGPGIVISWSNDCPSPSPGSSRAPSPEPAPEGQKREPWVEKPSPASSMLSSRSTERPSARPSLPTPIHHPEVFVKPEPMDVDPSLCLPPPPRSSNATFVAPSPPPSDSGSVAGPSTTVTEAKDGPSVSLVLALSREIGSAVALMQDLSAVDADPGDLDLVRRAQAHAERFFAHGQAAILPRLARLAERAHAGEGQRAAGSGGR